MPTHSIRVLAACGLVIAGLALRPSAQVESNWLDQWTAAQSHRPSPVLHHSRIAPAGEPGVPLMIHGLVLGPDGSTPVKDAIVFAYQTDHTGVYRTAAAADANWRLQGWARTDAAGRFEFETIRPAPYPNRQVAAHIHTTIESAAFGRQISGILFADDPLVPAEDRARSLATEPSGGVLAVGMVGGVQHVNYVVRLRPKGDF